MLASQRGQATLPDLELLELTSRFVIVRLSRQEQLSLAESLRVGKSGFPPLPGLTLKLGRQAEVLLDIGSEKQKEKS